MIRIDEIYNNVFYPKIISKPKQSMHYFDPFGSTNINDLNVFPQIKKRNRAFLFWDQEPYYPEHRSTIDAFHTAFIEPNAEIINVKVKNPVAKATFVTSEKNSKYINELKDKYGYEILYYFFHGWAALDWYRGYNRTFISKPFSDRLIKTTFICPNRIISGRRKHRYDLFKKLANENLVLHNKLSFPKTCPYSKQTFHIPNIDLPLRFGSEQGDPINESYKISLWEESSESLLHVVTETVYDVETLHLTEKIFKPIVMQMPFILVGARYNLEYLRSYGFKTFNDFWNEDYDHQNNKDRLNSIVQIIKELDSLSLVEKTQLQKHLVPIVEHNFNWFYSNEFENLLWTELTNMTNTWK